MKKHQAYIAAGTTVVLWASAFAGIRAGLKGYSPESLALLRYIVASTVLAGYAAYRRMRLPSIRDVPMLAVMGLLGFTIYDVVLNAGEVNIPAGTASFIVASAPAIMAILATLFYRDNLKPIGWLGIMICMGGVGIISFSNGDGFVLNRYALLVFLAAFVQALYSVGQRNVLKRYGAITFVTYAVWFGTLFLLIFLPDMLDDMQTASTEATLAIIYMGVFPGAIAYASWSYALSNMPASIAGSFLYFVPAFAVLIAWLWLGEVPDVSALIGGGFIFVGVLTVNRFGK